VANGCNENIPALLVFEAVGSTLAFSGDTNAKAQV
jgi:hypothetical protein